jgi:ATP/ADP translocase
MPLRRHGWSWTALVAGILLWVGGLPTFGLSVFLSPASLLLTGIAWRRDPHDAVFWIGFALNVSLGLGLLALLVGLLTGDVGIGFE